MGSAARLSVALVAAVTLGAAAEPDLQVLHTFGAGLRPGGPLLKRADATLIGTARDASRAASLLRIDAEGRVQVLHTFPPGSQPVGTLIETEDGRVIGVTAGDGAATGATIYSLDSKNQVTTLVSFNRYQAGGQPVGGLIETSDGNLYGVAIAAGSAGSVFRFGSDGTLAVVHVFQSNGSEGANPVGALLEFADGNFYGAASAGGAHGAGAIFRVSPEGETTLVHSFDPRTEGSTPAGGIVAGPMGGFYGVLAASAKSIAGGALYSVTADGRFAIVHDFTASEGASPIGELAAINDGSLLGSGMLAGITRAGGPHGGGTLYQFNVRTGAVDVLHGFGNRDGTAPPAAAVVQGPNGALCGLTDGSTHPAVVFRYVMRQVGDLGPEKRRSYF